MPTKQRLHVTQLGYWIVEPLVDRNTEHFPRGGIKQLVSTLRNLPRSHLTPDVKKRGLAQLQSAGISAILDHHALPGVQTPNQMFTGK